MGLYEYLTRLDPHLKEELRSARRRETVKQYTKKVFITSFYLSIGVGLIIFMFAKNILFFLSAIFVFPFLFLYFMRSINIELLKISREISKEVIFATRFLMIELQSGITLFEALKGVAENYESIGPYFRDLVDKVELGTPMEQALRESIEYIPSDDLRRVLWQILNSISTGGNTVNSLRIIINQIVREKQILIKEYGRKLSPLAMFYMTATIILPSIGTLLLTILAMFVGLTLSLPFLLVIAGLILFIQLSFLAMIKSSRPPVDI